MSAFVASNGLQVAEHPEQGSISVAEGGDPFFRWHVLGREVVKAVHEFFLHERDEQLGRWRWPENPDYVVYPEPDDAFTRMFGPGIDVVILRESDGMTKGYARREDLGGAPLAHRADHVRAARAYFEAHPEPKPWHLAKPGEVWVLRTLDSRRGLEESAWQITDRPSEFWALGRGYLAVTDHRIVDGRRIWPEGGEAA